MYQIAAGEAGLPRRVAMDTASAIMSISQE